MKYFKIVFFILLQIGSIYLVAQQPVYKKFDTSNGLPSNFVYQVMQDKRGYIWFATNNGVARYDGFEVEVFGSSNQLASIDVWFFYEDNCDRIWFYTYSGSFHYYCYNDEKFHTIKNPFDKGISQPVTGFTENKEGDIVTSWIQIHKNNKIKYIYYKIHPDLKVTRHEFNKPDGKSHVYRSSVSSDHFQSKFKEAGFVLIDGVHAFASKLYSTMSDRVFCFYDDNKKEFVAETHKGTFRKKAEELGLKNAKFYWIKILNDSTISFKFEKKIFITDLKFNVIKKYKFLSDNNLRQIYIDNYNNIWAITMHQGVFLYSNMDLTYSWLGEDYFEESNEIHHIAVGKDNEIFASSSDGYVYRISQVNSEEKKIEKIYKSNGYIRDLVLSEDKSRLFFILSEEYWNLGVMDLQPGLADFKSLSYLVSHKGNNGVSLFKTENFKSLCTKNEFTTIASPTKVMVLHHSDPSRDMVIETKNRTMSACYDEQKGILWTTGPGGVESYNIKSGKYETQTVFTPIDKIFIDSKNRIWLTSNSYGVFLFEAGIIRHVKETNGMIIYHAIDIDGDNFYIGTNHGLYTINTTKLRATKLNNLNENHIYAVNVLNDGRKLIGSKHGLVILQRKENLGNIHCDPLFKKFTMGNRNFQNRQDTIEVDRYDNELSTGIMIPCHHKGKFRINYTLLGYEKHFNVTFDNKISYKKLPYGRFTLVIKIYEHETGKLLGQRSIFIKINKSWTETWFFRILIFIAVILGLYVVYNLNIKAIKRKNKIKLEMDQMIANQKLVALQHQLNPHFVFNVLNSIQSFIMKKDTLGANYYLNRFSRLMRHVLESSRHLYIPLKLEIDILKTYLELERLRYGDKLNYEVIFDSSLDLTKEIPSMVIQPFVENAIKHGVKKIDYPGYINVIFNMKDNLLKVSVLDNGPGFFKQKEKVDSDLINLYQSRGLQITRERLQAFSELGYCKLSFNIEENHSDLPFDKGTCVTILIDYIES